MDDNERFPCAARTHRRTAEVPGVPRTRQRGSFQAGAAAEGALKAPGNELAKSGSRAMPICQTQPAADGGGPGRRASDYSTDSWSCETPTQLANYDWQAAAARQTPLTTG